MLPACAARTVAGETTFKQYVRDAGSSYLQPLNPTFETLKVDDNVEIIGRVIDSRPPRSVF
ncbi:S24 family peptidase [Pseudomonas aeruginosa]|nr:S24 family peptidase [Pseudomonas aeruginosa]